MRIPTFKFNYYGLMISISVIAGFLYIYYSLKKDGYQKKNIKLYFLMYLSFIISFGLSFNNIEGNKNIMSNIGLSSYGCLIGAVLSAIIFEKIVPCDKKLIKYNILSLPLTYGIAKIGCFLAGCCYGIPYSGPLSVTYSNGLNIPLFPVQIVESIVFILIFLIINKYKNNKYIVMYCAFSGLIGKFLLDFLRYDHVTKQFTTNQYVSIILIIGVIIWSFLYYKKGRIDKNEM